MNNRKRKNLVYKSYHKNFATSVMLGFLWDAPFINYRGLHRHYRGAAKKIEREVKDRVDKIERKKLKGKKMSSKLFYPVVIHHDENSSFGVTVPDFPGCFSSGETIEKAIHSVKEALSSHVEILLEEGFRTFSQPTPIFELTKNPDYKDGVFALIEFDPNVILSNEGKTYEEGLAQK